VTKFNLPFQTATANKKPYLKSYQNLHAELLGKCAEKGYKFCQLMYLLKAVKKTLCCFGLVATKDFQAFTAIFTAFSPVFSLCFCHYALNLRRIKASLHSLRCILTET
jgi:hypothetical protein